MAQVRGRLVPLFKEVPVFLGSGSVFLTSDSEVGLRNWGCQILRAWK